jgi:acetyl esterase/lipase
MSVEVTLEIWKGMIHVFQLHARFLPEARLTIEGIGLFMRRRIESEAGNPSKETFHATQSFNDKP